jgi:hypothetical protein
MLRDVERQPEHLRGLAPLERVRAELRDDGREQLDGADGVVGVVVVDAERLRHAGIAAVERLESLDRGLGLALVDESARRGHERSDAVLRPGR